MTAATESLGCMGARRVVVTPLPATTKFVSVAMEAGKAGAVGHCAKAAATLRRAMVDRREKWR